MAQSFETNAHQLLAAIEQHEVAEADAILTYQELSLSAGDPLVALVMRLILEDEDRHHAVLKRIAIMLRESPGLVHLIAPLNLTEEIAGRARERISAAIVAEHEGADNLARLAHEAGSHADGITSLLLVMLAKDSEKHESMLRFALDRLTPRSV